MTSGAIRWSSNRAEEERVASMRKKNQSKNTVRQLIAKLNPRSPVSEQYRTIRTNLQFASIDKELETMLVTSSGHGEGHAKTTADIAVVYAQQGKKVLLIDADLRKPTVHYTFRLDNLNGLSNLLVGDGHLNQIAEASSIDNLDIISCGPIPPNPSELHGSPMMH